jgi:hypothetical protein
MPKYELRIHVNSADDDTAKELAKKAASAVSGKVDKVMAEKLAFRSLED